MEPVDVEVAVDRRRAWLADHLDAAARRLHVTRSDERVVNTYDMRSAGTVVHDGDSTAWLRIVVEDTDYQPASRWEGNVEANAIQGVPKPTVLRWIDWHATNENGHDRRLRAELMTLAPGQPITPDGLLTDDPELPDQWWSDLNVALRTLATHTPAPGDVVDILDYTAHLTRELLGLDFDPSSIAITWSTAHADLHWANLTGPELCILDWESWRTAPAGYDAATLYCNSLLHPPTAQRVRDTFADLLDNPTGRVSLLAAALRCLTLADEGGVYQGFDAQLRELCDVLLDRLSAK